MKKRNYKTANPVLTNMYKTPIYKLYDTGCSMSKCDNLNPSDNVKNILWLPRRSQGDIVYHKVTSRHPMLLIETNSISNMGCQKLKIVRSLRYSNYLTNTSCVCQVFFFSSSFGQQTKKCCS